METNTQHKSEQEATEAERMRQLDIEQSENFVIAGWSKLRDLTKPETQPLVDEAIAKRKERSRVSDNQPSQEEFDDAKAAYNQAVDALMSSEEVRQSPLTERQLDDAIDLVGDNLYLLEKREVTKGELNKLRPAEYAGHLVLAETGTEQPS